MSEPRPNQSLLSDLLRLALRHKVYWIIPLALLLLLVLLMKAGSQPSAPFVYKLF